MHIHGWSVLSGAILGWFIRGVFDTLSSPVLLWWHERRWIRAGKREAGTFPHSPAATPSPSPYLIEDFDEED